MLRRFLTGGALLVGVVVACGGGGPDAPEPVATESLCSTAFCVDYPGDWEVVEASDDFVSLRHPLAPDDILATVGRVNMEGIVTAAGESWPQQPDSVVRSFWELIDGGEAELATLDPRRDGSVASFGKYADGRLWYRLVPVEFGDAIGVEVRGPNATWSTHADIIVDSVTLLP